MVPDFTGPAYGGRFFVRRANPDWTMRFFRRKRSNDLPAAGWRANRVLRNRVCVAFAPQGDILYAGPGASRLFDTVQGSAGRIGAALC